MKLKNQFLRLFALLGLSMAATTAWAANQSTPVQLSSDSNGGLYVNMPNPASDTLTTVTYTLSIPDSVTTFKVYDNGGSSGKMSPTRGQNVYCGVYLALTAPEGYVIRLSGSVLGGKGQEDSINTVSLNLYRQNSVVDNGSYGDNYINKNLPVTSPSRELLVEANTTNVNNWSNPDGLDLTVDIVLVVNQSGTNSHTVPAGKKQFEVQVPANVSNIDNTTTLIAPEGYVLYMPDATTPNGGSMTVEGNLSSTLTVHVTTESSGFASALNVPVHVLKKTTSTTAVDIYTQDDNSYAVAKITDGAYNGAGAVSISNAISVDAVVYDRVFTAGTPSTIVLPFQLLDNATTNAKFYTLRKVVQEENECKWKATMKWIGEDVLPSANTPYAVIVPSGTELTFNLNGDQASFQTDAIVGQTDSTGNWIFKGTYEYIAWTAADYAGGLLYGFAGTNETGITRGKFGKVGDGAYAAPMRAYMSKANDDVVLQPIGNARPMARSVSSIDLPESIDVEFVDDADKPMAIGRMNTVTGAIKIDRWFDLKGRSTNHKPTTKGAFFNKKGIAK